MQHSEPRITPPNRVCLALAVLAVAPMPTQAADEKPANGGTLMSQITKLLSDSSETLTNYVEQTRLRDKPQYTETWEQDLDSLPPYKPEQEVTGTIRVWGDDSLARDPLLCYWASGFHRYQTEVKFEFHMKSSLVGFPALTLGMADLVFMSHLPKFDESKSFAEANGHPPFAVVIETGSFDAHAYDPAFAIFVNKDNPLSELTIRQLDGILGGARSGGWVGTAWHPEFARSAKDNIRTWGQLGLTGEWASKPIHIYGYNARLGQHQIIEEEVFQGGTVWNETITEFTPGLYGAERGLGSTGPLTEAGFKSVVKSVTSEEDEMMEALGADVNGIAYCPIYNITQKVKALALAPREGGPAVPLTIENVQNRTYPLIRNKYVCINRQPGKPIDPKVKEFIRYILSRQGQADVVRDGKLLPLTSGVVTDQLNRLE